MSTGPTALSYLAPPGMGRIQRRSLVIGAAALVIAVIGAIVQHNPAQFFRSYLLGYVWWTGITLGCLAVLMIQHLAGGEWGFVIRRPLESAVRVFPLLAVLFVPLIFGIPSLYLWGNREIVAHDLALQRQAHYLAPRWFIMRVIVYFAAWIFMAYFLNRWSARQDESPNLVLRNRLLRLSGPGLVIYGLTVTFASVDWLMSLQPDWGSTIYPFILIAGQVLAAFSFAVAILFLLAQHKPMSEIVQEKHLHSLGKMMLAFVMLWAYTSYSQLLLIWAANLPDETSWYLRRLNTGWKYAGLALVVFHFAVPFALLLSRDLKRNARKLAWVGMLLLLARYLDLLFWIAPNSLPGFKQGIGFQWMDVVIPIGIGGIWMAAFVWALRQRPLVPLYDPRFEQVVGHAPEARA